MRNAAHTIVFTFFLFFVSNLVNGQTVYITKTGKKYHTKSCRYSSTATPTDLSTAKKKGLTACAVCKPSSTPTNSTPQKVTSSSSTEEKSTSQEKVIRCKAITKAGSQCSRNSTDGSGFCWQHKESE